MVKTHLSHLSHGLSWLAILLRSGLLRRVGRSSLVRGGVIIGRPSLVRGGVIIGRSSLVRRGVIIGRLSVVLGGVVIGRSSVVLVGVIIGWVSRSSLRHPLVSCSQGAASSRSMDLVINTLLKLHAQFRLRTFGHSVSHSCTVIARAPIHWRRVVLPVVGAVRGSELLTISWWAIVRVVRVLVLEYG